jgi:hypothetical protein
MLALCLLTLAACIDTCILRIGDINMNAFAVESSKDIVTKIRVVPIDSVTLNDETCDLSDPTFFSSLVLAYNSSDIEELLPYVRFLDSANASMYNLEKLLAFTSKKTITLADAANFVADNIHLGNEIGANNAPVTMLMAIASSLIRWFGNISINIANTTRAAEPVHVSYGWENMPQNALTVNAIAHAILTKNSVNGTLYPEHIYQRPHTWFEETSDDILRRLTGSQPFDKYGFRRITFTDIAQTMFLTGMFANFKRNVSMRWQMNMAKLRDTPIIGVLEIKYAKAVAARNTIGQILRNDLYPHTTGKLSRGITTMARALPLLINPSGSKEYVTIVTSVQRMSNTPSVEIASEHSQLIASAFLPDSSTSVATQAAQVFELSDIFTVRFWWDPSTAWSGFAPGDRRVFRMFGFLPIPADLFAFGLWVVKYLGRSKVIPKVFDFINITNPLANTTFFGVENQTLCLPAPGWFLVLPDPAFGCRWPSLGPAAVIFETPNDFVDYASSMLISNWTKYDPWLNPLEKIPAIFQLLFTSVLNETISNNPPLRTVISVVETVLNAFTTEQTRILLYNPNMPKYSWLTLLPSTPALIIIIAISVYFLIGLSVIFCIPEVSSIFVMLGNSMPSVSGNLAAQMKYVSNAQIRTATEEMKADIAKLKETTGPLPTQLNGPLPAQTNPRIAEQVPSAPAIQPTNEKGI